ncbi:MAG: 2-amino-4-hydroxy-6-hydroxymethyldihydropteridine diphosphokinase [Campylobacterota bacterium]|nr:2-amino-4-hydroxy-6-hydroxymethyldihydropteridine diphosphokinase [Campylobacterota bacterium]
MPLKRRLGKKLFIYKDRLFPLQFSKKSPLRYRSVVGIGGNIGDVCRRFNHLIYALKRFQGVDVMQSSIILKNPPFGYKTQDDFYNGVLELKTSMTPRCFLDFLLRLEKRFGRKRSFASAPRTLDIDIIFFDARVITTEHLSVPHPHWQERESVVIPLSSLHVKR